MIADSNTGAILGVADSRFQALGYTIEGRCYYSIREAEKTFPFFVYAKLIRDINLMRLRITCS